ncbi:nuclear transport factor 2 family protein (plasmid) [Paraburkholderia sp. PREW-6R]|uniref:nuclear transport factor 2 family protein n=1 Tax=Paraburkholderia sp. PREW-6R TaxID=3141544 RepID=UPI0031F49E45
MAMTASLLSQSNEPVRNPKAAAALFADDGIIELPSLASLGPTTGASGPAAIENFMAPLLNKVPDFRFNNVQSLIDPPGQAFGEHLAEALVRSAGKLDRAMYAGRLVAENGKIKPFRESLDTVAAQEALSPAVFQDTGRSKEKLSVP